MKPNIIIKDSTITKLCLITLIAGILALGILTNLLEKENTAIIKKINQNDRFLNITIQINDNIYEATAFTNEQLNLAEGDYIQIKGNIKNNIIELTKITKLKIIS